MMRIWLGFSAAMALTACSAGPLVMGDAEADAWTGRVAASLAQFGVVETHDPSLIPVEFRFAPEGEAETVHLTGDFASWIPRAIAMADDDGDGTWTVTHDLRPGTHLYKFVVDGDQWFWDPDNPERIDDGHEGFNSVRQVGAEVGEDLEPGAVDGRIVQDQLFHDPSDRRHLQRTGPQSLQITLRALRGDLESVDLIVGTRRPERVAMDWIDADDLFDHFRADLDGLDAGSAAPLGYVFEAKDGETTIRVGIDGAQEGDPLPFAVEPGALEFHAVPEWAMDAVWYQIFPERFRNGDPSNDNDGALPWTWDWLAPHHEGEARDFYHFVFERKFGGDLQGVHWALDYLEDLGVTALYLNPIFESISLHKYDAWDYRHVDDNFGARGDLEGLEDGLDPATWTLTPSDQVFLDLVADLHDRGMRVIVDGVFNHSGHGHWAFRDVQERGEESPYADWYKVTSFDPFEYEGWAGEPDLPEFAQDESGLVEPVAQHFFNITRRWMDPDGDGDPADGIDGWRLDVPNLVAAPFWQRWCRVVRETNPDAYTVGELWGRDPAWTKPDLFDAHMNYEWLRGVYRFFVREETDESSYSVSQLHHHLVDLHGAYDYRTNFVMQNLLDSHDTDRIASALMNPNREVDRENRIQDGVLDYDQSRPGPAQWRRLRLIQLFQFTSVGAPMIWYGDEVGMWGADDPECRKPMLWEDLAPYDNPNENYPDLGLRRHVQVLAHLRRDLPALRRGHLRPALLDDDQGVYAFERRLGSRGGEEDVYVALHRGEGTAAVDIPVHWPDGTRVVDAFTDRLLTAEGSDARPSVLTVHGGSVPLTLGPDQGAILVIAD